MKTYKGGYEMKKTQKQKNVVEVGKTYFFRTVTYHTVGKVIAVIGNFVKLENASWIADSGRFTQAIKDGALNEVEPVGEANINLDTVVDFFPWKHALPSEQK
jgi:hypothetical protein